MFWQTTLGAGPVVYWAAAWLWELALTAAFLCVTAGVVAGFGVRSYTAHSNLPATLALMLLYCTASSSLLHLAARMFSEPSLAQIVCLATAIFTALLTSVVNTTL